MASLQGDVLFLSTYCKGNIARPCTQEETCIVGFSHPIRWRSYNMVIVVLWGAPGHAHHGELPNRIPEAAFYKQSHALRRLPITRSTAPVGPPVGGQPQPTEAGRWRCPRQRIQRAHEVVGKSGERGRPKNSYTRCWLMRRHGWDSEDLQTPVSLRKVKSLWRRERNLLRGSTSNRGQWFLIGS